MKKSNNFLRRIIESCIDKIFVKLPDRITGKQINFEKEFFRIYGLKNVGNEIEAIKKENLKRYVGILCCFLLLIFLSCFELLGNDQKILLTDEKGRLYIERPTKGNQSIPLMVYGKVDGNQWNKAVTLTVRAEGSNKMIETEKKEPETSEEEANVSVEQFLRTVNKSDSEKIVYLPDELSGVQSLSWEKKQSNTLPIIIFAAILALLFTYLSRYDATKKLAAKCEESISQELPEFLNKIVLLMNAGLVLTAAFERIVRDYGERKFGNQSYFYNQLEEIHTKTAQVNSPLIVELKLFAERSRNREFMRLTNVMADNLDKGTELVSKLQAESSFLWFERKKKAEEKGKLAETKLTIPLAIQLLVLIMITVAPAMMEM
ncbi:type II secretion system F family protein [Clostridium aminobutyricum]|uniref:Type II secretion system F family protein n=1 Tax=Clostridium aminobutyricum TaxID=33953 RepID=A0A939IGW5_CLOAM|nr:type II secretion system F family protein [Clostridium aminobutyricum]MBN7772677.1 type II secretion system F family protein [Clostridium aminobutyricum]